MLTKFSCPMTVIMVAAVIGCTQKSQNRTTPPVVETPPSDVPQTQAETWVKYSSDAGRYSVLMPVKPEERHQSETTPAGILTMHLAACTRGNAGLVASYTDYPEDVLKADPQKLLDSVVEEQVFSSGGKDQQSSGIAIGKWPGRQAEYTTSNGHRRYSRSYFVGPRLYQLMVETSSSDPMPKADMDKFFNSFKLKE